jgi:DNA repair photolyase
LTPAGPDDDDDGEQKANCHGLGARLRMNTHPLLFDLGARNPTSRDIADTVRHGGTAALTGAERRADHARYQEISCRSALNPVKGMPFDWTLNPYRGCTHGCHYCYARRYHQQFEMNADDEFASVILVKTNVADVLTRELARPSWTGEYVAVGTATDCYQPIEGHYKLTRRSIQALLAARNPMGLITKGPMVVRDRDLLVEMSRVTTCTVCMSVPTVDEQAWQQLEPGTAHPLQRLRAVRDLVDAGVSAGVIMNPIVPGFSSSPAKLERTVKAIADHGARFVGCNVMFLEAGTRAHFMSFLQREFPSWVPRYEKLYERKYAPREYRKQVQGMVRVLQERYGLHTRREADAERAFPAASTECEQVGFAWEGPVAGPHLT